MMVGAVVLNAVSTVLYIGAGLGPGPRDGLMTGLVVRTGLSVRLVRTSIEAAVLTIGWLLGGTVGIGTVLYAFGIGPLVQLFLRLTPRAMLFHDFGGGRDREAVDGIITMGECPQPEKTQPTVPVTKTC